MKHPFVIFILISLSLISCKHEIPFPPLDPNSPIVESEDCDPSVIYFQQQVLPIFQGSCATIDCHDQASHEEGMIFDSYANIIASGEITAGNPSEGDITEVITESDPDKIMPPPPYDQLSSEQIQLIFDWIEQGAQNNSCSDLLCDTLNVTFSMSIAPLFDSKCDGCHGNVNPQAGLVLETYSEISTIALNGLLWNSVTGSNNATLMPYQGIPLADCELRMIEMWIENGAPND